MLLKMKGTDGSYDYDPIRMSGEDERTMKEIRKIRELDASIRELEVQLKVAKRETTDLQSRACEMFKKQLAHVEPSGNVLIKNSQRFLDLFDDSAEKDLCNEDHTVEEVIKMTSLELKNADSDIPLSMGDEEKERLEVLTNDSTDRSMVNPYRISESPKKTLGEILEELQDK